MDGHISKELIGARVPYPLRSVSSSLLVQSPLSTTRSTLPFSCKQSHLQVLPSQPPLMRPITAVTTSTSTSSEHVVISRTLKSDNKFVMLLQVHRTPDLTSPRILEAAANQFTGRHQNSYTFQHTKYDCPQPPAQSQVQRAGASPPLCTFVGRHLDWVTPRAGCAGHIDLQSRATLQVVGGLSASPHYGKCSPEPSWRILPRQLGQHALSAELPGAVKRHPSAPASVSNERNVVDRAAVSTVHDPLRFSSKDHLPRISKTLLPQFSPPVFDGVLPIPESPDATPQNLRGMQPDNCILPNASADNFFEARSVQAAEEEATPCSSDSGSLSIGHAVPEHSPASQPTLPREWFNVKHGIALNSPGDDLAGDTGTGTEDSLPSSVHSPSYSLSESECQSDADLWSPRAFSPSAFIEDDYESSPRSPLYWQTAPEPVNVPHPVRLLICHTGKLKQADMLATPPQPTPRALKDYMVASLVRRCRESRSFEWSVSKDEVQVSEAATVPSVGFRWNEIRACLVG